MQLSSKVHENVLQNGMTTMTINSRLPFGKYKGKKLAEVPPDYILWMSKTLINTDLHEWGLVAKEIIEKDGADKAKTTSLEEQADEILRKAGYTNLTNRKNINNR